MAKMFYTMDETKAALGKSEDEIKQFIREGRLREFRDGPRQMFKADQVDAIKAQIAGGGIQPIDLGPSDSGSPIGMADSKGGSGALGLADSTGSSGSGLAGLQGSGLGSGLSSGLGSGLGSGIAGSGSGMMNLKEDTALSADLGLSGTAGAIPSPARIGSGSGSGTGSGGPSGSRSGINVFGDEEEKVDPMAQTAISSAPMADLNLEGIGSGSGLLDLTRESDDTSLGAELLDEISPGQKKRSAGPPDTGAMTAVGGSGAGLEAPRGGVSRGGAIVYQEAADPFAGALGGFALGAAFILILGLFVLVSALFGVSLFGKDETLNMLDGKNFMILAGGSLVLPVLFGVVGLIFGKSGERR
jgi:hypothetical protein